MAVGNLFLYSVIKSGNRNYLNRVKDELFHSKPGAGEPQSELDILNFIRGHVLNYRTLPSPSVLTYAGIPYTDTEQPPEYYLQELKKRSVFNAFKKFQKAIEPIVTTNLDVDKIYEVVNQFSSTVSMINVSDRFKTLAELGREIETQIEGRKSGAPEVFVPFGWPSLDSLTGGMAGGDLAYFIARPGIGKTNVLSYVAHHAWTQGFSPMLLTMEMTDVQISRRIYGLQGQFNPDAVRRGIPDLEVESKLGTAIQSFDNGPPFHVICGQVRQTVESITALIDELQPDVVYIDAAYLVSMNGPAQKAWEKLAVVSERLKQVAITRNIPIIMTVQFNRDAAKGKRYELDTIAGSDAIGQLGSVIISIREGEEPYADSRRVLNIIKNREGGVTEFDINNRFDPPDFTEVGMTSGYSDTNEEVFKL